MAPRSDIDGDSDSSAGQTAVRASPWVNADGGVEVTVKREVVDQTDLSAAMPVSFYPTLVDSRIEFEVTTDATGNRANERRLKQRTEDFSQTTLRFPAVLAQASGLTALVDSTAGARIEFEPEGVGHLRVGTWPRLRPTVITRPRLDLDPVTKRLLVGETTFGVELPHSWRGALDLADDQPVAFRLSAEGGELALVADFDVGDDEWAPVRELTGHSSGRDGSVREQFRMYIPKALIHALGWESSRLQFSPGERYITITEVPRGTADEQVDDAESAETADAAAG